MKHPEFPLSDELIYLNHAAVAPWPKRTSAAVIAFAEQNRDWGSHYYPDWLKKELLIRRQLRDLLNAASADDIALVKNTSEALSFVACGLPCKPATTSSPATRNSPPTACPGKRCRPRAWNSARPTCAARPRRKTRCLRWWTKTPGC